MKRPTFALLCIAAACHAGIAKAESQVRSVAGKNVELVIPPGFCAPDTRNAADANFVKGLSTLLKNARNVLVQTYLSCEDRKRRRASAAANIYDYISYYYPTAAASEVLDGDRAGHRKALCGEIRKASIDTKDVQDSVAKSAEELRRNVAVSNVKDLGVLAEDEHGCYSGILVGVDAGKDNSYLVHAVIGATILNGKYLFFALYSKYVDEAAAAKSLRDARSIATELDSKNPN
jgi:hypothetical protein